MSETTKSGIKKWGILAEKTVYECEPWIRLNVQKIELPDGNIVDNYHHLVMPEYVVVFPVTSDKKAVMLKSYRHGVRDITHIFPGGFIDKLESPLDAAKRELLEETGYKYGHWQSMGTYVPHSNYGCGKVHMFEVKGVCKVQEPKSGDLETAEVHLLTQNMVNNYLSEDRIATLSSISVLLLGINRKIFD